MSKEYADISVPSINQNSWQNNSEATPKNDFWLNTDMIHVR